MKQTTE